MTPRLPEPDFALDPELAPLIAMVAGLLRLDAAVLLDQRGVAVLSWHAATAAPAWLSAFSAQLPRPSAPLVVPDTRRHPDWAGHPAVLAQPGLRFVAAAHFGDQTLYLLGETPRPDVADFEAHLDVLTAHGARWAQAAGTRRETLDGLRGLVEGAPLAMYALTLEGLVKHWNAAAEQMLGWRAEELIGRPLPAELAPDPAGPGDPPDQPFGALQAHARLVRVRRLHGAPAPRDGGSALDLSVVSGPLRDRRGNLRGLVNIAQDVTGELAERRQTEQQRRLMESVLAHANDSVLITEAEPWDEPGPRILYANAAFTRTTGYTAEEVLGKTPRILQGPGSDRAARDKIRRALEAWQSVEVEILNYRKDGSPFWVELSIAPVADETGWYTHWISIQRDITERKLSEERLDRERNLVLELAAKGAPLREVLLRLVGMVEEQFAPMRGAVYLPDADDGRTYAPGLPAPLVRALLAGRPAVPEHFEDVQAAPHAAPLRAHAAQHGVRAVWAHPIRSSNGALLGTFALFGGAPARPNEAQWRRLDAATQLAAVVIERDQAQVELERRALYDALTGLPNRVLFQRRLQEALERAQISGQQVAVGLIDLDRFKVVNDTLGHSAGDALLQQVAARLASGVRPADTLARMGGDEFLLVLSDVTGAEQVHAVAERFLTALTRAFLVAGQEVFVRPSIGFTTFPNDGGDPEVLLQQADTAMYRAKALGGGCAFYAPQPESGFTPMALESALNHALDRQEFVLHYQPQRRGHDGAVVGVEALLRWRHPTLGLVSPAQFIPLAETTGLIVPIGSWVLREACAQAVRWSRAHPELRVAVNLSARQFQQDDLIGVVTRTLAETGLAPQRLELELTESLLMSSPDAPETLRRLKALGVRVAIDDFGTGYSSLAYLKKFALDVLKIDRSFVQDLGDPHGTTQDASIIRAVIGLAHGLGLEVVAEGVEHERQLAFLREHGCDFVQGFLLGRPQEASALEQQLAAPSMQRC